MTGVQTCALPICIVLGAGTVVDGGPTGFDISGNDFDTIYAEGIIFGNVILNVSSQNVFYDVGNYFGGTIQPSTTVFDIQNYNNVSIGDMFQRTAVYATVHPRIQLNDTASIAMTNAEKIQMGSFTRLTGQKDTLLDDTASPTTIFSVDCSVIKAFTVSYTIVRSTAYRTGTLTVVSSSTDSTGDLEYTDDFVENSDTGITLSLSESLDDVNVLYTSTSTGSDATITYSVTHLG